MEQNLNIDPKLIEDLTPKKLQLRDDYPMAFEILKITDYELKCGVLEIVGSPPNKGAL